MSQREFNILKIILLCLGGGVIYVLPYLRHGFWDSMIVNMNLTNLQLGQMGAVYMLFGIPSYFIGGVLADKYSPRLLLIISFISTGMFGFYFATLPSYTGLLVTHAVWGITTNLTYYSAFQALTRLSSSPDKQAKAFGIVTAGRSILYLVLSSFAIWLTTFFVNPKSGLSAAITLLSVFYLLIGLAFIVLFKAPKHDSVQDDSKKFKVGDIVSVLKIPEVWMLSMALFTVHFVLRLGDVFTPFASSPVGLALPSEIAGILGMIKTYGTAPIGGLLAVLFADRFGRVKFSMLMMIACSIATVSMIIIPTTYMYTLIVTLLGLMLFCWIAYMLTFAILDDFGVPDRLTATTVGTVSCIGFTSEMVSSYTIGYLMDAYPGLDGFHRIFQVMAVSGIISIGVYFLLGYAIKRSKAKKAKAALA